MRVCPSCQKQVSEDAKHCSWCGIKLPEPVQPRRCPRCQNMEEADALFCTKCGMSLTAPRIPVVQPVTEPVAEPKKKGKTGIILAVVVLILALITGAVAWVAVDQGWFEDDGYSRNHRDDEDDDEDEDEDEDGEAEPTIAPPDTELAPEPVTLTVWAPSYDYSSGWMDTMCANFEQAHPEYAITWQFEVVSEADAGNLMLADPAAGADVYMFANDQLGALVEGGALLPINGTILEDVRASNSEAVLNSVTYGGDVYGIPYTGNTWWMYYDKSVFTEEDVKSLEAMLAKGKVAFPLNNGWYFASFYFANGCTMFGPYGNDAVAGFDFGGEKAVAVTNYLVDLVAHPNFICDDGSGSYYIRNGDASAFMSGSWEAGAAYEALGDNLGVAQLPTITIDGETKQLRAFAGCKAIGVNLYADNLIASYLLAAYLGSPEGQMLRYELSGVIPCDPSLADRIANDPVALAQLNSLNQSATVQPTIPEMGIWWDTAANLANEILAGSVTHQNAEERTYLFNDTLNAG